MAESVYSLRSRNSGTPLDVEALLALKKAKAQAARTRVQFALQQSKIQAEKARLDADLTVLNAEIEHAAAEAEVESLEESLEHITISSQDGTPVTTTSERIQDFLESMNPWNSTPKVKVEKPETTEQHLDTATMKYDRIDIKPDLGQSEQPVDMATMKDIKPDFSQRVTNKQKVFVSENAMGHKDLSTFLLKRDLMLNRLDVFNEQPEMFQSWKRSFKNVIQDLEIGPTEEIDLLIKHLGPKTRKFAESVRLSCQDPLKGLNYIWERLEERFNSPEIVEASLKNKVRFFPKLSEKDREKWYDFLDILIEIESLKSQPAYSPLLAVYDTSGGLLPIIRKLPYKMQEKWVATASHYKMQNKTPFPPFSVFCNFIQDICRMRNDPGLNFDNDYTEASRSYSSDQQHRVSNKKTDLSSNSETHGNKLCPFHKTNHTLNKCRRFREMSLSDRKKFLKDNDICFRCCESTEHKQKQCKTDILCELCQSNSHSTPLHCDYTENTNQSHGGELQSPPLLQSDSKCTKICGSKNSSRSCAKIVPIIVSHCDKRKKVYAILDEQSNRSLVKSELLDSLSINTDQIPYLLSTCSGKVNLYGRKAQNLQLLSLDEKIKLTLGTAIECNDIPDSRSEIPTPCVADGYRHLKSIKQYLPHLDDNAEISILIGRDLPEAHHVLDQRTGPPGTPYAQKTLLGWVIIGEVCPGKVHLSEKVNTNKTYFLQDDRPSLLQPCSSQISVKEKVDLPPLLDKIGCNDIVGNSVFVQTPSDDKPSLSIEDRRFLEIMNVDFKKTSSGYWSAPLPFRNPRVRLPNNREYTYNRTKKLISGLRKNPAKAEHFIEFMSRLLENGHAEMAPPLSEGEESWFLPLFGVYHPKKPNEIRCVFDSSAKFDGISLNSTLIQGPDLFNSLLGVLLRFRKEQIAIMADIKQMFYSFQVHEQYRNYLRFFWFSQNDLKQELIEYRMTVHVFGNTSSPSIASYGLRKIADEITNNQDNDVKEFIMQDFYVDDGLKSVPTEDEAISLIQRTQSTLKENGNLILHKISSNSQAVMEHFPSDELSKNLKLIDLSNEEWPVQRSLGLLWSIKDDTFTFQVSKEDKCFTRRGVLSTINSVYDPLGFATPITIQGKLLLQDLILNGKDWDEPLPAKMHQDWKKWKESLFELENLKISRPFIDFSLNLVVQKDLHIYCDASERAISSVAYIRALTSDKQHQLGFLFGKSKLAPKHSTTIPRLELCSAVLGTEIYETLNENLNLQFDSVTYHTDSKIVLGYLNNETRRFYTYVSNRIERIRKVSKPYQWLYIDSGSNPADLGTRGILSRNLQNSIWLKGPTKSSSICSWKDLWVEKYPLIDPDCDKEIRQTVNAKTTEVSGSNMLGCHRFERFSSWERLVNAMSILKHVSCSFKHNTHSCKLSGNTHSSCNSVKMCLGWHICRTHKSVDSLCDAERQIIKSVQSESFKAEIDQLTGGKSVKRGSPLYKLNPVVDSHGLLRVGGRLRNADTGMTLAEKQPIIVSKHSHIAKLLIKFFHEKVEHQGRLITEGAILSGGFWIIGAKRLIASLIHQCVKCRKLRGRFQDQRMADLPSDRVNFAPPFSYTGVDVFGPWTIVARKTRGGVANSKRWAVIFTCLTIRAIHIEIIDELSSSAFINALKRFISIRGEVSEFRSDRGSNFIGAVKDLNIQAIHVEDGAVGEFLQRNKTVWKFNPPYSSNFGGAWERMIRTIRNVLNSILLKNQRKPLTHDNLVTFMAEVCCIVNNRPIIPIPTEPQDSDGLQILSPNVLLTQKPVHSCSSPLIECDEKLVYRSQWKNVQALAEQFWKMWKVHFLQSLQPRQKWVDEAFNIQNGDFVMLKDRDVSRNDWPVGIVSNAIKSSDGKVRKVELVIIRDGKKCTYTRSVRDLVLLLRDKNV